MKHSYFVPVLIIFITVINAYSCQNDLSGNDQKDTITYTEKDTAGNYIIFEITNMLPIGWGTKYNCKVLTCNETFNDILDDEFILSVSVGSEETFKPLDIHFLNFGKPYIARFLKAEKNDKPYTLAGTTGFVDNTGYIWLMTSLHLYQKE